MKLRYIALRLTRYSDSHNILAAYSRERGRVSLSVPAGRGREAGRLKALSMPLTIVECEIDERSQREIMPLRQARVVEVCPSIGGDPLKQMMAMFIAELVVLVTRDSVSTDTGMYEFLEASVKVLELMKTGRLGNFHICFLYHLGRLMGVEPDVSTRREGYMFDMRDGVWRGSMPLHGDALTVEESDVVASLTRITFANQHLYRYSRAERARVLDLMMRYLSIHLTPLTGVKSLDVLRAMF